MGILKRLSDMIFSRSKSWFLHLPNTSFNYGKEVGTGLDSSVLVSVIFWIMRRFAEAKMVLNDDEELIDDHELLDLMRRPNSFYSGRSLRSAVAMSYKLDGNAYMIKIRGAMMKVVQLWYVPNWMIEPHWPQNNPGNVFIDYYSYKVDGIEYKIDPEDVIHVRFGLDPKNVRKGLSAFKALIREIFTDDEAANFMASLLRNFGIPGLIISPGSDEVEFDKDAPDEIKAFFKTKFSRDRRGEPLVLRGKTDIKQFGFDPKSMDLGRLRQIPEERVCSVLGVPAAIVGFGTGMEQTKVGATMKELREAAYEDCIIPMQNNFAEELDNQLLNEFETDSRKYHVDFDLSDVRVLQEDENKKAERITKLVEGSLLTVGEGLGELGYEVRPEHDVYIQKINIVKVPAGEIIEVEEPDDDDDNNDNNNGDGNNGNGNGDDAKRLKFKFIVPVKQEWVQTLIDTFNKDCTRLHTLWSKELTKSFKKLGKAAREAWEKIVEEQGVEIFNTASELKAGVDDIYAGLVSDSIDPEKYVAYVPHYLRTATVTFDTIKTIIGLSTELTDVAEARIAASGGTRRGLLDLTKQTKDSVMKAIAEARSLGEGPHKIAARIEAQCGAGPWSTPEIRADVISRTETKYAQNVSSIEAYKSSTVVTALQVVDGQLGDRSCDVCLARDGLVVSLLEAEIITNEEHPNGTLSWVPVMGELTSAVT